jgi:ribonuclease HI
MRIFVDGSYDDKRKVGGWGLIKEHHGHFGKPISNYGKFDSINETELFAIYEACILSGGAECEIITDSQTALSYIKGEIKDKPRTHEQYIRHKHCEFWACKIRKFTNCTFTKQKAHQSHYQRKSLGNRMADLSAKDGLAKFYEHTLNTL